MNILSKISNPFRSKPFQPYLIIGEEKGVYELVRNFYTYMEKTPEAKDVLLTHELNSDGSIPDEVKKKLFMFLCGWFGGPNLFIEEYGHPRMRARHGHVKIGEKEKNQWLDCMNYALEVHTVKISKKHKSMLFNNFVALATRIQNQA